MTEVHNYCDAPNGPCLREKEIVQLKTHIELIKLYIDMPLIPWLKREQLRNEVIEAAQEYRDMCSQYGDSLDTALENLKSFKERYK